MNSQKGIEVNELLFYYLKKVFKSNIKEARNKQDVVVWPCDVRSGFDEIGSSLRIFFSFWATYLGRALRGQDVDRPGNRSRKKLASCQSRNKYVGDDIEQLRTELTAAAGGEKETDEDQEEKERKKIE